MFKTSKADHLGNLAFTEDIHLIVTGSLELFKAVAAALAHAAVEVKRGLDIVDGQVGA